MQHHPESKTIILHDTALVHAVIAVIGKVKYGAWGRSQERVSHAWYTEKCHTHTLFYNVMTPPTVCKWYSYHEV